MCYFGWSYSIYCFVSLVHKWLSGSICSVMSSAALTGIYFQLECNECTLFSYWKLKIQWKYQATQISRVSEKHRKRYLLHRNEVLMNLNSRKLIFNFIFRFWTPRSHTSWHFAGSGHRKYVFKSICYLASCGKTDLFYVHCFGYFVVVIESCVKCFHSYMYFY